MVIGRGCLRVAVSERRLWPLAHPEVRTSAVQSWRTRWRGRFIRFATYVLLPLIIAVFTAIAAVKHGPVRVYWCLGAFAAVSAVGFLNYYKDRITALVHDEAVKARIDLAATLTETGRVLVALVGDVAASAEAQDARRDVAVLINRAVDLARTAVTGRPGTNIRAIFYRFDDNVLIREKFAGPSGCVTPRRDFVPGRSDHDDEVLRFAHGEDVLWVRDLENEPPPHFVDAKGRSYKSLFSVPVRVGSNSFGLLTVDINVPDGLTEVDRDFIILIAGALGAGLAHVNVVDPKRSTESVADPKISTEGSGA